MIRFVIPGAPASITAQQKGIRVAGGKAIHYTKSGVKEEARRLWASAIQHRPPVPLSGPIFVTYRAVYPMTREQIREFSGNLDDNEFMIFKESEPDWDNSIKLLQDVLSCPRGLLVKSSIPHAHFWRNDASITDAYVQKRAGCNPRIEVTIQHSDFSFASSIWETITREREQLP